MGVFGTFPDRKILSLCLIVKNEEKHIERFVNAWSGWYDELILADTGSSDSTKELAIKVGATLIEFPWCDDFSAARNAACNPATSEWIFCPDADEIIMNPEGFYRYLASVPDWMTAVQMDLHTAWENYQDLNNKGEVLNYFPAQRCFRNHTHEWSGAGHEYIKAINGAETKMGYCRDAHFEHHPDPTKSRSFYIDILRKQANQNPDEGRYLHYMGREAMYYDNNVEALGYFSRCLEHHHWDFERCQTRLYMANCYLKVGEEQKAIDQIALSLMEEPSRRDSTFAMGEYYRSKENWARAVLWYKMCLAVDKPDTSYFMNDDLYGVCIYLRLAHCLWSMQNTPEAQKYFEIAKKMEPKHPEVIQNSALFEMPKVGIIIPTRFREELLNRTLEAIKANTQSYPNMEVTVFRDEKEIPLGCPKATNQAVKSALSSEGKPDDWVCPDYICFLGNDTVPQPNWLNEAMLAMRTFPDGKGMVGFNEGYTQGLAHHFVIHKDLIDELPEGKLFWEEYTHNFVDNELRERMEYAYKYRWCSKALIVHSWYSSIGTTPDTPLRTADECDERTIKDYAKDEAIYHSRRSQWVRELSLGVEVLAGPDSEYVGEVLDRLLKVFKPEQILGVMGDPIIEGDFVEDDYNNANTESEFGSRGIPIAWCDDRDEVTRRNFGLDTLDTDWTFVVDTDELWEEDALRRVIALVKESLILDDVKASVYTYWKTPEWRIDPPEPLKPTVCVKKGTRFMEGRNVSAQISAIAEDIFFHHYSYVGNDSRIEKKLKFLSHPNLKNLHPIIPDWFEKVWKNWTPDMKDIHPTHPGAYAATVKVEPLKSITTGEPLR